MKEMFFCMTVLFLTIVGCSNDDDARSEDASPVYAENVFLLTTPVKKIAQEDLLEVFSNHYWRCDGFYALDADGRMVPASATPSETGADIYSILPRIDGLLNGILKVGKDLDVEMHYMNFMYLYTGKTVKFSCSYDDQSNLLMLPPYCDRFPCPEDGKLVVKELFPDSIVCYGRIFTGYLPKGAQEYGLYSYAKVSEAEWEQEVQSVMPAE